MTQVLRWTGYPLVDVGAAGIAAFAKKSDIDLVTLDDMHQVADYIADHYPQEPFKSFLTAVFPNSGYVNPTMSQEKRLAFYRNYLRAFELPTMEDGTLCVFCARPAQVRAFREHIPLTMSRGMINFVPNGVSGLSVCGLCLLCIQAAPLASVRCEGRLLVAHSSDHHLTLAFARAFFHESQNQTLLTGVQKASGHRHPKTLLLHQLESLDKERMETAPEDQTYAPSLSIYHLTNYGTGADIAIYHLPFELLRFLRIARSAIYADTWNPIVKQAWEGGGKPKESEDVAQQYRRNRLYEDFFSLPQNAPDFIRQYFLPRRTLHSLVTDGYGEEVRQQIKLVSWKLTNMFLRIVMNMDKSRINAIATVGDRIAAYIMQENEKQLFRSLLTERTYRNLRWRLVKAKLASVKQQGEPLITFDEFVKIFEESEDVARVDWNLARDLLLIKIIDELGDWLSKSDVLESVPERASDTEESEAAVAL
jgi:CRISPR-associated protein Cst1